MSKDRVHKCKNCGVDVAQGSKECPNCGAKQKNFKWWYILLALIVLIIIIASLGDNDADDIPNTVSPPLTTDESINNNEVVPETSKPEATESPETQVKEYTTQLSSGYYTAGIDFPGGTYDIKAISGSGNVSSDNMFNGGINAIMGVDTSNEMYEQEYANIKLPDGTVLSVSGLTIEIYSDNIKSQELKPRNQTITETVDLGNGNFVSGEDFEPGVYDIVAVSGGGNVSSDNILNGGINAIMGVDQVNDMYEKEYKNIELPKGTTITVDGVKIQLVPSK